MTGANHVRLSLLAVAAGSWILGGELKDVLLPATIGGLWPDTDCRASILGRCIPLWLLPGVKHRGITHTYHAAFLYSLLWQGLVGAGGGWFLTGYILHLWSDHISTCRKRRKRTCKN